MNNIAFLVPGERWEAALVARTQYSLLASGLPSSRYQYHYGDSAEPRTYEDALAALLSSHASSHVIVIPAGYIASPDFVGMLADFSIERSSAPVAGQRTPFWISHPRRRRHALPPALLRSLSEIPVARSTHLSALPASFGHHIRKRDGADLFQNLGADHLSRLCESPVSTLSATALSAIRDGWVYRCNNEAIELELEAAADCETLVAVGAGIKPWWIANALRRTLKQMIVVDSHLPQLAFAQHAMTSIGDAPTWRHICDEVPFRSIDDLQLRPLHDRIYRRLVMTRKEWSFTPHFVVADLHAQTFNLLECVQKLAVGRTCLWYSNVFRPYTGNRRSEHHAGVESSFLSLVGERLPGSVCFNTGVRPVQDPWSDRLHPDLRFRLRRGFDALTAGWRDRQRPV